MPSNLPGYLIMALAAASAHVAIADETDDGLEEVVVWGDRLEETLAGDLEQFGSRLERIEFEQIENGGYFDSGQALQNLVPGLYVAPKNGAFDYVNVSLLGARTSEALWLVDGVRISNRLYNTTTPLDTIPAHMIERIEVLKGGHGLFYGTQAVGGVINIITKDFSSEPQGSVSVAADGNDGRRANAYASTAFGAHHLVLYGSYDDADGFQPFDGRDYQPSATDRHRSFDVTTLGLKYGVDLGAVRASATYQHTEATLDFAAAEDRARSFNERNEEILSAKLDWSSQRPHRRHRQEVAGREIQFDS
jgi:vitamin B12 transporter